MFLLVFLVDAVRAVFTSLWAGPPAGGELRGTAGFAGDDAFCVMFPSFVLRHRCLHLGQYGPEGQLHGASLSWCRGLFPWSSLPKTIEIVLWVLNKVIDVLLHWSCRSLVSGSLLYGVRCSPVEYQTTDFPGRKYLRIQHSLVRQWIHVGVSLRGF